MNTEPSNSLLLAVAVQAARRASQHAFSHQERRQDANSVEHNDVKLKLDEECQAIAIRTILESFPEHSILAEEDTEELSRLKARASEYQWIIDPIDGTVNFFHGNPYWCCSVAVQRNGETLAGAIVAPGQGLIYEAAVGVGALCNGAPIQVSKTVRADEAQVLTGADKSEDAAQKPFRFFNAIAERVQRPRVCGSAALDICAVARGTADGYFEPGIYVWDIAAADLILRMAGGRGEALHRFGGHKLAYLASNGSGLHDVLAEALKPLI